MKASARERQIIRPAIDARVRAISVAADPENPYYCPEAAQEIEELRGILRAVSAQAQGPRISISVLGDDPWVAVTTMTPRKDQGT